MEKKSQRYSKKEFLKKFGITFKNNKYYGDKVERLNDKITNLVHLERNINLVQQLIITVKRPPIFILICGACSILIVFYYDPAERRYLFLFLITIFTLAQNLFAEYYYFTQYKRILNENQIVQNSKIILNNKIKSIPSKFLQPGNLLVVERGDIVGADSKLIECYNLTVNNYNISGKSKIIKKSLVEDDDPEDSKNIILTGNGIISGYGIAVVLNVGTDTVVSKIIKNNYVERRTSGPIYQEFESFYRGLLLLCFILSFLIILISVLITKHSLIFVLDAIMSIFFEMLPEGITAVLDLSDYQATKRLNELGILVNEYSTIEHLALIDNLIINSKNVLFDEKMKCSKIYTGAKIFEADALLTTENEDEITNMIKIISVCKQLTSKKVKNKKCKFNKISRKDILSIRKLVEEWREKNKNITLPQSVDKVFATSTILKQMLQYKYYNGKLIKIQVRERQEIKRFFKTLVLKKYKVIVVGFRENHKNILVGILGFVKIPKNDVMLISSIIQNSNIQLSLFKNVVIKNLEKGLKKLIGLEKCYKYDKNRKLENENSIVLFNESSEKLKLIDKWENQSRVIGCLSNNIKETMLLSRSSLGMTFSESSSCCKQSSSIIIKRFEDILSSIIAGRLYFLNLQKSVKYVLLHITPQTIPILLSVIIGCPMPTTPLLIFFSNFLVEIYPLIFFVYEKQEINLLGIKKLSCPDLKKHNSNSYLVNVWSSFLEIIKMENGVFSYKTLQWSFFEAGFITTATSLLAFFYSLSKSGIPAKYFVFSSSKYFQFEAPQIISTSHKIIEDKEQILILYKAQATYFNNYVVCQFFNMLCCRRKINYFYNDFFENKKLLIAAFIGTVFSISATYISFSEEVFLINHPDFYLLFYSIFSGLLLLAIDTIKKYMKK